MSTETTAILSAGAGSVITLGLAAIKTMQGKAKELADAVLIQNEKHNALEVRIAVLESKLKEINEP